MNCSYNKDCSTGFCKDSVCKDMNYVKYDCISNMGCSFKVQFVPNDNPPTQPTSFSKKKNINIFLIVFIVFLLC